MKRALFALALLTTSLQAQTLDHKTGITFSVGEASSAISFRRLMSKEWSALASIGASRTHVSSDTGTGLPLDATSWTAAIGARRYFGAAPLRPFAQLLAGVQSTDFAACGHIRGPHASAAGGVEYVVAQHISIEGSAGLSYTEATQRCSTPAGDFRARQDALSTFSTALSITFYF